MANIYWTGPKAKKDELVKHIMDLGNKRLPDFTHYGVRFDEGLCEIWIECEDPNEGDYDFWQYFEYTPKMLGWRTIIVKCPIGYMEAGIKTFVETGDAGVEEVKPIPSGAIKKMKKVQKKAL